MKLPSNFAISAAQQCGQLIGSTPITIEQARVAYSRAATHGLYGPPDLGQGEALLHQIGIISVEVDLIQPTDALQEFVACSVEEATELVVSITLNTDRPAWLSTAVHDEGLSEEYIPEDAVKDLERLISDPDRREAALLAAGYKHDEEDRLRTGGLGELAVLEECRSVLSGAGREDLARQVRRVSEISDALGYDLTSPTLTEGVVRIEVKTTRASTQVPAFLSRNESNVGRRDPSWRLVACRLDDEEVTILGHCTHESIEPQLPADQPPGRWRVARLELREALTGGLPL